MAKNLCFLFYHGDKTVLSFPLGKQVKDDQRQQKWCNPNNAEKKYESILKRKIKGRNGVSLKTLPEVSILTGVFAHQNFNSSLETWLKIFFFFYKLKIQGSWL